MPIKRQSISLNYYQYSYDTNTGKWKDPVEVMYKGVFWKNKAISLMINLNRITHEPFNEDALYKELVAVYDQQKKAIEKWKDADSKGNKPDNIFKQFCMNHPLIKQHFLLGGCDYVGDKNLYNLFEIVCRPLGINKPPFQTFCQCTYGKKCSKEQLKHNFYIINPFNHILVVIGSECVKKIGMTPFCIVCGTPISPFIAIEQFFKCKDCKTYNCKVCHDTFQKKRKSGMCKVCKRLGDVTYKPHRNSTGIPCAVMFDIDPSKQGICDLIQRANFEQKSSPLIPFVERVKLGVDRRQSELAKANPALIKKI